MKAILYREKKKKAGSFDSLQKKKYEGHEASGMVHAQGALTEECRAFLNRVRVYVPDVDEENFLSVPYFTTK